jgi:hypothetical protein
VEMIAVTDTKGKRIMTEGDVLAFVQLMKFQRTGVDPREIEKVRGPNDAKLAASLTAELRAMVEHGGMLPEMLPDSTAFWTGLLQNWASLTTEEKDRARNYVGKNLEGLLTDLPEPLYARLMGWSSFEIKMAGINKNIQLGLMWAEVGARMRNMKGLYDAWYYGITTGR